MATIFKRGDGQWEAAVRRSGYPAQRRTFGSQARAIEWGTYVEAQMDAGTFQAVKETRGTLLSKVIARYKAEVATGLKDHKEHCRIADVLDKEFGRYGVLNLPSERISAYRDRLLREGLSGSTVNHHLNTLSAIYTAAVKAFHMKVPLNPVRNVIRAIQAPARRQRVSDQVVQWLIEANEKSNAVRKEKGGAEPFGEFPAFLRLALSTAMRRGEIAALEWSLIDFDARTATLPDTKIGEPRIVPLSDEAIGILKSVTRHKGQARVFRLGVEGFKTAYRRARDEVVKTHPEVGNVRFHDTRREATTRMAKKLPNVVELAAVTGHKKLDTLKIYYRPDPTELARKLSS